MTNINFSSNGRVCLISWTTLIKCVLKEPTRFQNIEILSCKVETIQLIKNLCIWSCVVACHTLILVVLLLICEGEMKWKI